MLIMVQIPIANDLNILILDDFIDYLICIFMFKMCHSIIPEVVTHKYYKLT